MAEQFEFIDCQSISISYQITGLANVSFTVVSTEIVPGVTPARNYTELSFGGIDFKGFITQVDTGTILGSVPQVFEHKFTLVMSGCAVDCPRGT